MQKYESVGKSDGPRKKPCEFRERCIGSKSCKGQYKVNDKGIPLCGLRDEYKIERLATEGSGQEELPKMKLRPRQRYKPEDIARLALKEHERPWKEGELEVQEVQELTDGNYIYRVSIMPGDTTIFVASVYPVVQDKKIQI